MAESQSTGFGFSIRPLEEGETATPSTSPIPKSPPPPQEAKEEQPPAAKEDSFTGALFFNSQTTLSFLGAVAGAGLANRASAYQGPDGKWWAEVNAPWQTAAALAWNAGGQPYAGSDRKWNAIPADGSGPPSRRGRERPRKGEILLRSGDGIVRLQPEAWKPVDLSDLVVSAPLRPRALRRIEDVVVITPGALGRTLVSRALSFGFEVELAAVVKRPLVPSGDSSDEARSEKSSRVGAILLRIHGWTLDQVPRAFIESMARLPLTAVTRGVGTEVGENSLERREALLIDVRYDVPLSNQLVASMVPEGERWLLAGPEVGHWRVDVIGKPVDGRNLVDVESSVAATVPPLQGADTTAETLPLDPLPMRLARRRPAPGSPDAVLIDDQELSWCQSFLAGQVVSETAFLIAGPGAHLILAPGGLLSKIPFGLPLRRVGPGGLYLEEGQEFTPPLPRTARAAAFPREADDVVVICRADAEGRLLVRRYSMASAMPVWMLWAGDAPQIGEGVEGRSATKLLEIAARLKAEEEPERGLKDRMLGLIGRERLDQDELLRRARIAENAGRLAEAAEHLEEAGELLAAGRLYERAAAGHF